MLCAGRVLRVWLSVVVAVGILFVHSGRNSEAANTRPNVVVILADDLGYGDPGCYNAASKIPTPNIDRLAREGMRFTDAHTPSAVCTPTRYGLLTGRYCWRTRLKKGVLWGYSTALIDPQRMTLASLFKSQGYATAGVGKWHLGLGTGEKTDYSRPFHPAPTDYGFDTYFGIPASLDMDPYVFVRNDRVEEQPTKTIARSEHRRRNGGGFWRAGAIAPSFRHIDVLPRITQEAVGWLESQAKTASERPFFLYFPLTAPHTPWLPTDEFRGRSKAGYYGDFVVQVDWTVGQVLQTLDRLKLRENTLVVFTSDNGAHWPKGDIERFDHRANGPWRGQKADIWEGGHRVPFIVRWPGHVEAGATCDATICLTDLMATFAALLDVPLPADAGEDSFNILPLLRSAGQAEPVREAIVHHSVNGTFAIRQGSWKLILGLGSGGFTAPRTVKPKPDGPRGQLYNLAEDPAETRNLYLEHPEIVARLTKLLERYQREGRSRPVSP